MSTTCGSASATRLAAREWSDVNQYAAAKGELIEAIIAKAKT